jgi:glycosyltransferase involved in cell wall biosynthesis
LIFWLIKDGEPLPVQQGARKMRMGMLCDALVERGHIVRWWSSTFSHQEKKLLYNHDIDIEVSSRFRLTLLYAGRYSKNISLRRYLHHRRLAEKFRIRARESPTPDCIVAALPIIELAWQAVKFGAKRDLPVVVDVRDPWPDVFVNKVPQEFRGVARLISWPALRQTRNLLSQADSLVGVSHGFLEWALRRAGRRQHPRDRVYYLGYPESDRSGVSGSGRMEELRKLTSGQVVFTFVGSFGRSYELALICELARELAVKGVDGVHFILAGDGEQRAKLTELAQGLRNLSFTGWIKANEIGDLLSFSDVGLASCHSAVGTVPNKLFEYLAAGLPILSSLEGEAAEIIDRNEVGFSYRPGDLQRLRSHVLRLASDTDLRRRQSRNARSLYLRNFRANMISKNYARHLEEVVAAKSSEL